MEITELIEQNPWMLELEPSELSESCKNCAAKLGERHTCGWARCLKCFGQYICCDCDDPVADNWEGIYCPHLAKICVEQEFYCRDLKVMPDGSKAPVDWLEAVEHTHNKTAKILWHQPCKKGDPGWHLDYNRATRHFYSR